MNKNSKKIISALLSAAVLLSVCAVSAFAVNIEAAENDAVTLYEIDSAQISSVPDGDEGDSVEDSVEEAFAEQVTAALEDYTGAEIRTFGSGDNAKELYAVGINISELELVTTNAELVSMIQTLIYDDPILFYVDYNRISYTMLSNGVIHTLYIALKYSPKEIAARLDEFNETTEEIIDTINAKALSDFDRALMAHDYIVERCEYDTESAKTGNINAHGADAAIIDRLAVCQGYSSAYKYLLTKMGIECVNAYDSAEGHEWSMIKLGDNWYHVDLTFDDPTPDKIGNVSHAYFLLTDDEITSKASHASWDKSASYTCEDTTYSDAAWRNSATAVVYYGDSRYFAYATYADSKLTVAIYKSDADFTETEVFCPLAYDGFLSTGFKLNEIWKYIGFYGGLYEVDGSLYFNTATSLRKIDLTDENAECERIYTPYFDGTDINAQIYGSYYEDGVIYYAAGIIPTGASAVGTDNDNIRSYELGSVIKADRGISEAESALVISTDEESGEKMLEGSVTLELDGAISAEDTTVYLGVYENGALKQILTKTLAELSEDGVFNISVSYDGNNEYAYKAFAWGGNYVPYSGALTQAIEVQSSEQSDESSDDQSDEQSDEQTDEQSGEQSEEQSDEQTDDEQ